MGRKNRNARRGKASRTQAKAAKARRERMVRVQIADGDWARFKAHCAWEGVPMGRRLGELAVNDIVPVKDRNPAWNEKTPG